MTNGSHLSQHPTRDMNILQHKEGNDPECESSVECFSSLGNLPLRLPSPRLIVANVPDALFYLKRFVRKRFWWIMDGWLTGRGRVTVSRLPLVEPRGPLGWWLCGAWYAEALWSVMLHALTQRSPTFFWTKIWFLRQKVVLGTVLQGVDEYSTRKYDHHENCVFFNIYSNNNCCIEP